MQSSDREEFKNLLAKLCAGFNVPLTKAREDAYWSGLAKMTLVQLSRCIDYALGDEYVDDHLPTTKGMWRIFRQFRAPATPDDSKRGGEDKRDHLEFYANRLLLRHTMSRHGLGSTATFIPGSKHSMQDAKASTELAACLRAKRALIDWFIQPVLEGDDLATPQLFIGQFIRTIAAVSKIAPEAMRAWQAQCEEPAARLPFPKWMARALTAEEPDIFATLPAQQPLLAAT